MSDTLNLAGKDIIVDHVTTNDGPDTLRALQLMNAKRNRNGVDDLNTSVDNINDSVDDLNDSVDDLNDSVAGLNGSVNGIMGKTCRIGARASGTTLDVYAYNPLNRYSTNYSDDYYVTTGYVECNGQTCPVSIPTKHITFSGFRKGTWSILIKKADPLDEVWSVYVAIPEPDQNSAMRWKDTSGNLFSIDTSVWVIGFFTFSSTEGGVYNLFVSLTGTTPMGFLKDRFMQVMNDCEGADTENLSNWAVAMKCDAIFKRLAVLEAFVSRLNVNSLEVGGGGLDVGFLMRAQKRVTDDGNGNITDQSIFEVRYNGTPILKTDVQRGTVEILNANVRGDFTSTGFATSKASDTPVTLTESSNDLTQYYDYIRWMSWTAYRMESGGSESYSYLTLNQRAMLTTNGIDTQLLEEGDVILKKSVVGTFRGSAFTSVWYVRTNVRSHEFDGKIIDGVLWIVDAKGIGYSDLDDDTHISTVTIDSNTVAWTDQYIYQGYLLTSAYLSDIISVNSLPTGNDLEITSGTVTVNGTAVTPSASLHVYMNISASSLTIYDSDHPNDPVTFSEGNFYQADAFAFSSATIATSMDGIKTMHIVPYSNAAYDIGTSSNKYKDIWGTAHFS